MDMDSIGERQCLNANDGEVLASGSEANSGNPTTLGRNRDASATMIGLVIEDHCVAGTCADNRIITVSTDVKCVTIAAT